MQQVLFDFIKLKEGFGLFAMNFRHRQPYVEDNFPHSILAELSIFFDSLPLPFGI